MTVHEFKELIQGATSYSVWIMASSGNNFPVKGETYAIVVDFDLNSCNDCDYLVAVYDKSTGNVVLRTTSDDAKSAALTVYDSYEDGIVLEGEVY